MTDEDLREFGFKEKSLYLITWNPYQGPIHVAGEIQTLFYLESLSANPDIDFHHRFMILGQSVNFGSQMKSGSPKLDCVKEWKEIPLTDLPLYISWPDKTPFFYQLLKGEV
jgi:hypothetical protein